VFNQVHRIGRVILLLLVAGLTCGSLADSSASKARKDIAAARSCRDVEQLFGKTHDWFLCRLTLGGAITPSPGGHFQWERPGEKKQLANPAAVAAHIKEFQAGQECIFSFNYTGLPNRGYFHVHVNGAGKVTKVDDFALAD
jgi:hypothetical protein